MEMPKPDPTAVALLERLADLEPRVQLRKMFGQPAAFLAGRLCFGTFGPELFLRLGEADRRRAEALPGTRPFEPMAGRPMTGYLILDRSNFDDPQRAREWVGCAVAATAARASSSPRSARRPKGSGARTGRDVGAARPFSRGGRSATPTPARRARGGAARGQARRADADRTSSKPRAVSRTAGLPPRTFGVGR